VSLKRRYRAHSAEFKAEAVRMVEQGERKTEVARKLGLSVSLLDTWVGRSQGRRKVKEPSGESEQIRALERELRKAQMERDILKKAVVFFAKENL